MTSPTDTKFWDKLIATRKRWWWAVVALVLTFYEFWVLYIGFCAVNHTWPGNKCTVEYFQRANEVQLLSRVTAESLLKVSQAEVVLAGWKKQGIGGFSAAEIQTISQGLMLAAELRALTNNHPSQSSGTSTNTETPSNPANATSSSTSQPQPIPVAPSLNPLVPLAGDLRRLSDLKRQMLLTNLDNALRELSCRAKFSKTNCVGNPTSGIWSWVCWSCPTDCSPLQYQPRLTSSEVLRLQAENAELAGRAFQTCSKDFDLLILLMALGAIGSATASLASIGKYLGDQKFLSRWAVFYFVRPITGAVLAMLFYLLLASRLMTIASVPQLNNMPQLEAALGNAPLPAAGRPMDNLPQPGTENAAGGPNRVIKVDPSSVIVCAAIAVLVGLFSDEAMKNLSDVADALFRSNQNKNALTSKVPRIIGAKAQPIPEFSAEGIDLLSLASQLKASTPGSKPTELSGPGS